MDTDPAVISEGNPEVNSNKAEDSKAVPKSKKAISCIASVTSPTEMMEVSQNEEPPVKSTGCWTSSTALKRCLSVPSFPPNMKGIKTTSTITTRSATAAAAAASVAESGPHSSASSNGSAISTIPLRARSSSRDVSPAPVFNIFAPRARRYSASYSPAGGLNGHSANSVAGSRCLTPRISQLRQEESLDISLREINHEREVHNVIQLSQSWEDLTLVAENWSCKSDDLSNPLQAAISSAANMCSSPSPTNTRNGLSNVPKVFSPSPTRRVFTTRRSMSPIAIRSSQLGPVKRKFELEENSSGSNWNIYCTQQPPMKKFITESSRGSSPSCQSPSSVCPSPDSGTYDGRITPKLFISKLCTSNNTSHSNNNSIIHSACSSPVSASPHHNMIGSIGDHTTISSTSMSSISNSSRASASSEPMFIGNSVDEGISVSGNESEKTLQTSNSTAVGLPSSATSSSSSSASSMLISAGEMNQDDAMDDVKSDTMSIGACSSISADSLSSDSIPRSNTLSRMVTDDVNAVGAEAGRSLNQKHFFINKHGLSGAKKFIVNHEHLSNNSTNAPMDSRDPPSTPQESSSISTLSSSTI